MRAKGETTTPRRHPAGRRWAVTSRGPARGADSAGAASGVAAAVGCYSWCSSSGPGPRAPLLGPRPPALYGESGRAASGWPNREPPLGARGGAGKKVGAAGEAPRAGGDPGRVSGGGRGCNSRGGASAEGMPTGEGGGGRPNLGSREECSGWGRGRGEAGLRG